VISRRTIVLAALCSLGVAVPTAYSKGRIFEGRRLQPDSSIKEHDVLNAFPIVFIRTLVGGEPEVLRLVAGGGLLLSGVCLVSLGFDFAPKVPRHNLVPHGDPTQHGNRTGGPDVATDEAVPAVRGELAPTSADSLRE
jgi:hypothetical protein